MKPSYVNIHSASYHPDQDDKWCMNIWFVILYSILSEQRGWVSRLASQLCVSSAVLFCVWCTAALLQSFWAGVTAVTRGAWGQCCVHGILSIITTLQEAAAGDISWLQQVSQVCRMYQHRVHWPALRVSSWCHAEWSPGVLAHHHERVKHHGLRQHDSVQPLRHWRHGQGPLQDAGPGQWPVPSGDHHLVMPHKYPVNVAGVIKKSYYWLFIAGRFHYEHLHCDRIRHGSFHLPQCNQRV